MQQRNRFDPRQLSVNLRGTPLDLDNQQRLAIGVARMGKRFAGTDARPVHELNRHRQQPGPDDIRHASPRHLVRGKPHQNRPRAFRFRQNPQGRLGHHAQLAFRPANHPQQIQAWGVTIGPANFDHRTAHQNQSHAEQIIRRHAIFQTMRPAGIHRDIARDGTSQLAGRVGRIKPAIRLDSTGHAQVGPPALHPDEAVLVIRLDHCVHPRHAQNHAIRRGIGPPRQRSPRPARHHLHSHLAAQPQNRRNLRR